MSPTNQTFPRSSPGHKKFSLSFQQLTQDRPGFSSPRVHNEDEMLTHTPLSVRRRAIARANLAKSSGPVIADGKAPASRNAVAHGFRGQNLQPDDDPTEIAAVAGRIAQKYGPGNPRALAAAHAFALASSRSSRLCLMEAEVMNREMARLSELPVAQRRAWAGVFKHYVFEANDQTVAHIPPDARHVLAPIDAAGARQLRAHLLNRLKR